MIPFNKPYLTGNEFPYMNQAVASGKLSGNGIFTQECHNFFKENYGFKHCLLTSSCTDALEMSALLLDIQPGDEVIVPSYTFVSTANAFVLYGAKIVFADSRPDHPGMDEDLIESLITEKSKAIVVMHYAGVACDMEKIMEIAEKYHLYVVEDSALAFDSFYLSKPLGGIGHFGCFSFHETKNVQCGEGGMLVVNDENFAKRAEVIWEKGTNRAAFQRGEVNHYNWVDVGSSFLPSELTASFLFAQLEKKNDIQNRRKEIWEIYYKSLKPLEKKAYFTLPVIPDYAVNNAHEFYLICKSKEDRERLLASLNAKGINAIFHYLGLHKSFYYQNKHDGRALPEADRYSECLLRLPMFYELTDEQLGLICDVIRGL